MPDTFDPSVHPHRRRNALTGQWVVVSPQRTKRPWQGQLEKPALEERPQHDPDCYLCPGNDRAGGVSNPDYTDTFFSRTTSARCFLMFLKARPAKELVNMHEYFDERGTTLLSDYLAVEVDREERIVCDNEHFDAGCLRSRGQS